MGGARERRGPPAGARRQEVSSASPTTQAHHRRTRLEVGLPLPERNAPPPFPLPSSSLSSLSSLKRLVCSFYSFSSPLQRVFQLGDQVKPSGVGSARLSSGARYDGEWKGTHTRTPNARTHTHSRTRGQDWIGLMADLGGDVEGKEHGYGVKFWPIVAEAKQGGEEDASVASAQSGDGGGGSSSSGPGSGDASADGGEDNGSVPSPSASSSSSSSGEEKKVVKPAVEYDKYEGMWKDGWEHGVGKYTWYTTHACFFFCFFVLFGLLRRLILIGFWALGRMGASTREIGSKANDRVRASTSGQT
jgi:hypothetical protein